MFDHEKNLFDSAANAAFRILDLRAMAANFDWKFQS